MKSLRILTNLIALIAISSCQESYEKEKYLLEKIGSSHTGIDFMNQISDSKSLNIVKYLYLYNGAGVSIGDINNDGLQDIYFVSNKGSNKLYLNKGNLQFEDITKQSGTNSKSSWNTGVTMVDINGDNLLDIYLCSVTNINDFFGHNELFINNGDGTFTEKSKEYGLDYKGYSTQAYFFDYDKDDDLDVYIVNHAIHTKDSHGPSMIREKRSDFVGDVLLKNEENHFIDVSSKAKIYGGENSYGLSASISDFNNDGWEDIYVCNDFHEDDYYYLNNKDGTFTESLSNSFLTTSRFSMGCDASDINNDGLNDLITLDMLPYEETVIKRSDGDVNYITQDHLNKLGYKNQFSRNALHINRGKTFDEVAFLNNIHATDWSWAPLMADFNNDSYLDIFITNGIYKRPNDLDFMNFISNSFKTRSNKGADWLVSSIQEMPDGKVPNQIYKGNSKKLENVTGDWMDRTPNLSNGSAYADLDNDGDIDLVINNLNEKSTIYENTSKKSNFLAFKLQYKGNNVRAIGSEIKVYQNNKIQTRSLQPSRGFSSSSSYILNFGLGDDIKVDSVIIKWPNLKFQKIINPAINELISVTYEVKNVKKHSSESIYNSTFTEVDLLNSFSHKEDNYKDFANEKLLQYKVSTAGPALAKGDVNNDGKEDLYIGNGSGYKSALFVNTGHGFKKIPIPDIEKDSLFEDTSAEFFDFDNDNDLDLYVGSGINTSRDKAYELDRLYMNDGNGQFKKTTNKIPPNTNNTKVITSYDYDTDGDIDLFVGNWTDPNNYGEEPSSYLLENNNGTFTKNQNNIIHSFVTDAKWQDINNDGTKDLLISAEWNKPIILLNFKGEFTKISLPRSSSGLWQTIISFDIDNDGDKDIVLGNWGENTRLEANLDNPLTMYYSDFNNDSKKEALLTYSIDKIEYPMHSKNELSSQIIQINKLFQDFSSYSGKSINEIFGVEKINKAKKNKVYTLSSGYILNENSTFKTFIPFEDEIQKGYVSTILNSNFKNDRTKELLFLGNFHGLRPYHSSLNSLNPVILETNNTSINLNDNYKTLNNSLFNKQMRNAVVLDLDSQKVLIVVCNNDKVKTFYIN